MSGVDLLPPEIWYQILTKLPVKSILRCRSVCRTWYSLISCPNFVSDHTAQTLSQSTGDRMLVHNHDTINDCVSTFSFHDKSFVESPEHHDVPQLLLSPDSDTEIVGSCDGLICFYVDYVTGADAVNSFLIWNPSIGKLVELPLRYSPYSSRVKHILGFGFDSKSRDYKVVRVVYPKKALSTGDEVVGELDIFDLGKGVRRSSSSPMRAFYYSRSPVCLHGNVHWIGSNYPLTDFTLVSFNLSSEVLHEMETVPDASLVIENDDYEAYIEVKPIKGLLSLAVVWTEEEGGSLRISVWSMKEYGVTDSWTKLFNFELPDTMNFSRLHRFMENGEVLLVERVGVDKDARFVLVLYNPDSRKSKALFSTDELISNVCFYKESLILM